MTMARTWKVILAFTGIFLAGAVAGGFVSLRFVKVPPPQVLRQTVTEQQWVVGQMRRFINELKLDEAQRVQVKPALDRAAADFQRLRRRSYRETMDIIERMNDEITPILSDDQKENFEDIRWLQRKRIEDLMMGPPKKPVPVVPSAPKQNAGGSTQPEAAAPAQPKVTAPAKPEAAAPAQSKAAAPATPKAAVPAPPTASAPAKPNAASSAQPKAVAPVKPKAAAPSAAAAVAPAQSEAATSAQPKAVAPVKPATTVPAQPEAATPAAPPPAPTSQ